MKRQLRTLKAILLLVCLVALVAALVYGAFFSPEKGVKYATEEDFASPVVSAVLPVLL